MDKIAIKKIPKKVLVVKPSSLGDIVHSLPFLRVIRDTFPLAEIHWVVAKGLEGLLENHPMVNKLWTINKDRWKNPGKVADTLSEFRALFADLRSEKYDIAIDIQGLLRSGVIIRASRAPVRVGFREAREGSSLFYTHKVRGGRDLHAVERYLKVAHALGGEIDDVTFPMPLIKQSEKVTSLKKKTGKYAVIVPGARWKTKRWPAESFSRLASMLDIKSVIVGSPSDSERSMNIEAGSGGKAVSLAGKTDLKELISVIRDAKFVISNDSGPMHIAAAFRIPVFALFGPTNPVRTGPYGSGHTIIRSKVQCSPCYKKSCRDIKCMNGIPVDSVYETILKSL